jgi:hypothetical protein
MMPGTTNFPARSITVEPAGAAAPVPMSRMRPFSITIVTWACGGAPLPSISVASRMTVTCAAALPDSRTAASEIKNEYVRMVAPRRDAPRLAKVRWGAPH